MPCSGLDRVSGIANRYRPKSLLTLARCQQRVLHLGLEQWLKRQGLSRLRHGGSHSLPEPA